jgi:hypothetical protein
MSLQGTKNSPPYVGPAARMARRRQRLKETELEDFNDGFYTTALGANMRELETMSDEALATWQSERSIGSAAHILAEKEWERRLAEKSIRATRKAMWVTAVSTLASVVVGWALGFFGK